MLLLEALIDYRGTSLTKLSKASGISVQRIKALIGKPSKGKYEGIQQHTIEHLKRLADALEYPNNPEDLRRSLSYWERGADRETSTDSPKGSRD